MRVIKENGGSFDEHVYKIHMVQQGRTSRHYNTDRENLERALLILIQALIAPIPIPVPVPSRITDLCLHGGFLTIVYRAY